MTANSIALDDTRPPLSLPLVLRADALITGAVGCIVVLFSDAVSPNALGVAFIGLNIAVVLTFSALQEGALRNRW